MSWSGNCLIPKGTKRLEAEQILGEIVISGNEDCPRERDEAVTIALDAVRVLLEMDNAQEDDWQCTSVWNVSVGGHVNPGHVPRAGWSNDCTTISISQKSE